MPSGTVHTSATIALATGLGVAAYFQAWPLVPLMGGALAGLVINPDLDIAGGSTSHKIVRKAGCLLGLLWRAFWWPYSQLIPHRHWMSHAPVISTIIRMLYITWPALIWHTGLNAPAWWPWAFAGLAAADGLHIIMDSLFKN